MARTSGPYAWGKIIEKAFKSNQRIKSGRPRVIVYSATPNAAISAPIGTLCWDVTNLNAYINTDASTTWVKINA